MRIGILPVDSRPCNHQFGKQLGAIYQKFEVDVLPLEASGYFMERANMQAVEEYLIEGAARWDYAVISADMLCFGGLIQAREYSEEFNEAYCLNRLQILRRMKQINPQLKLLAYSVIMRLSVTASSNESVEVWENLFEYSKYAYLNEIDAAQYGDTFRDYASRIPQEVLDNYLTARKRNHVVNKTCIDLVSSGVIDYLDLCQEDSHQYGLHVKEQEILSRHIQIAKLEHAVTIKNGTDEEVSLLFGRCVNLHERRKPCIYVHYMRQDPSFIALYEDRPLVENIEKNLSSSGCTIVDQVEESELILIVSPFPEVKQTDIVFEDITQSSLTDEMKRGLEQFSGVPYAFLDVTYANGGSKQLLEQILDVLESTNLMAYSAWNTASNSIGTIAGHLSVLAYSDYQSEDNLSFLMERIIDDCLYQGVVRGQLNRMLKEQGEDVWRFKQPKQQIEELLRPLLQQEVDQFLHRYYPKYHVDAVFSYPWDRTFELKVAVNHIISSEGAR